MNLLSVENLTHRIGERLLFQNLQFGLAKGDKVALVARNGMGKTTLLRILAKADLPQEGKLTWRNNLRVGYLAQEPAFSAGQTLGQALFQAQSPMMQAVRAYEVALSDAQHTQTPQSNAALQQAMAEMDAQNAWDYEAKVAQVLERLKVKFLDRSVESLSGGQRKRLGLAQLLLDEPDVLLLDEPTNHLDIEMIEWLEEYLLQPGLTVLLVTHDRYFLDEVCNRILEIDRHQMATYEGNYSYFLERKAERMAMAEAEVARAQNRMRTELEWLRRQPKARGTKSKARVDAFEGLQQKASIRLDQKDLELKLKMQRQGSKIVELHKVSKQYGDLLLLDRFSYTFKTGDRIGVVGPNGAGKSTLLKLIAGETEPDAGKVVIGETTVFGHYRQDGVQFKPEQRMIELIQELSEAIEMATGETLSASQFLEYFQFPKSQHYTRIADLSGGERRRLHLVTVLMRNPNFLILDEPTNDLDLHTLQALEEFLMAFPGVLLIVSHDRFLLDRLADHLFILEGGGGVRDYNGSYQAYRHERETMLETERAAKAAAPRLAVAVTQTAAPPPSAETKRRLSYKEAREYEALSQEISVLEARKAALSTCMSNPHAHYHEIQAWAAEMENIIRSLDVKSDRWLELSEHG